MTRFEAFEEEERRYQDAAKEWNHQGRKDIARLYQSLADSYRSHRLMLTVEEAEEAI